jgi:hypothetical protein
MAIEPELKGYLEGIRYRLRLNPAAEKEIVRELYTHIEDRAQELKEAGLSQAEATKSATERFGRPEAIATEIYQVHSKGNWRAALLAAMPHLLIALLFALYLWHNSSWVVAVLISMLAISAYGWRHGRPSWFHTWLGYALVPIFIATLLSLYALGRALFYLLAGSGPETNLWILLAIFAYLPLSLWLLVSSITGVIRRDWLYGSLMALPLPAVACWLFAFYRDGSLFESSEQYLQDQAPWVALSFFALAIGAATFIRLKQRLFKGGMLLTAEFLILIIVACADPSLLSSPGLVVAALLLVAFLFSPALLEHKIGHRAGEIWIDAGLERWSEGG